MNLNPRLLPPSEERVRQIVREEIAAWQAQVADQVTAHRSRAQAEMSD